MHVEFLQLFMKKTGFPEEAQTSLLESAEMLSALNQAESIDSAVEFFYGNGFDIPLTQRLVEGIGKASGLSPYTVWLLLFIEAAQTAKKAFQQDGIAEEIFWETFSDLRCKALECREIHGVWGTFVAFWYPIFYSRDIVKLGRLEFENYVYPFDQPYTKNGITVKKGDPVKNIHIPSSGEPFDQAARLNSYRQAYAFFQEQRNGGPLVCMCHSYLLFPEYGKILNPSSNVVSFQKDFDIIGQDIEEGFGDAWRLFGADYQKPTAELPERTSMQRAFKKHLLSGGKTGEGRGILIFDGEKIVNR